jgi:hypothetical protein
MNRRKFLITAIVSVVAGTVLKAVASTKVYVAIGKLGYKTPGPIGRQCVKCKYFEAKEQDGICKLRVMKNVMKASEVYVTPVATCNMWGQK